MTFANNTTRGQLIPERDKVFIANFYSHAFVGIFFDWIRGGMKQKPEDLIDMMGRLLNGSIYDVLQRGSQQAMVDRIAS